MIALVDCNSFFCSVEKVFHPGLNGKPVCVLSSNDGCIVALTPEAKALGLRRGDPIFKKKEIVEHGGVKLFSTNMMLYAAMSKRVNHILRSSVPHAETYSIDESFLYLDGLEKYYNLEDYMRSVAEKVKLYTDIPVSVGIAPTKTLAKIGSKFAKQYKGYRSVCMIDNEEKRRKALALFDLSDVWGIGKQTLAKLNYLGITTPLDFADKKESWVRSHFTKPGLQTWKELNGIPCIDTSEVAQRQTICTSRSFGNMITDYDELQASVASFAASCANKLRGQHSLATAVTVFVSSNRFREDL
ncbi:UmuC protein, partial [gut metagenome]